MIDHRYSWQEQAKRRLPCSRVPMGIVWKHFRGTKCQASHRKARHSDRALDTPVSIPRLALRHHWHSVQQIERTFRRTRPTSPHTKGLASKTPSSLCNKRSYLLKVPGLTIARCKINVFLGRSISFRPLAQLQIRRRASQQKTRVTPPRDVSELLAGSRLI